MRLYRSFQKSIRATLPALVLISTGAASFRSAPTVSASVTASPPTAHSRRALSGDPVTRLQARLDAGEIVLSYDSILGYLPALLRAFNIPTSSQSLVFSRTSLRTDLVAPWSPRALYFNDDVYVGWVQGSEFLEIAAVNPTSGAVFYTFNQEPVARPNFTHESNTCLMCHKSRATGNAPGFLMLSTIADRLGYQIASVYTGTTTDQTPLRERFGGWYVTGTDGKTGHSGNVASPKDFHQVDKELYRTQIDLTAESARTDLTGKFDASPYLTAYSDIVALMVLVHQTSVHNLITATHEVARMALLEESVRDHSRDSTSPLPLAESNATLRAAVERLVRAMLFADEVLLESPMRGTTNFPADFVRQGPRDKQGRSLRDFDLERRLFKYPLSFLIYTEGFDSLPDVTRKGVYKRLHTILDGQDTGPEYVRLKQVDRRAIVEILNATKPEFVTTAAR